MHKSIKITRASIAIDLTQEQWDKLETLSVEQVQEALPDVFDIDWNGHFGMVLYFGIETGNGTIYDIEDTASNARKQLMDLLKAHA